MREAEIIFKGATCVRFETFLELMKALKQVLYYLRAVTFPSLYGVSLADILFLFEYINALNNISSRNSSYCFFSSFCVLVFNPY